MTKDTFHQQVIEKSEKLPVLVDFWAPWCGPCRVLGPVIEGLAEEHQDRWALVKVNTEEAPDIAERYAIRSIPNVKLFHRGEVIGEFTGALGKVAIERWLDEHLPDPRKDELAQLLHALEAEETGAVAALAAFVDQNEDMAEARLALAQHLIWSQPANARELVAPIRLGQPLYDQAEDIRTIAELLAFEANGEAVGDQLAEANKALQQQDLEKGIQCIIDAVATDKTYHKDLPRRSAIALFRLLGDGHPLTKSYRWRFDMALY